MALAETRHFSRAAEQQYVSQPTFSRRIKLLEEAMGTTLINRQTLPLSLTREGELFLGMCERVSAEVRETRERIATLQAEAESKIPFAATQSLFSHFFQEWAHQHQLKERLALNLKATSWIGEDYLDALDQGECELILIYWHADLPWAQRLASPRFRSLTLDYETLVPYSIVQNKVAQNKTGQNTATSHPSWHKTDQDTHPVRPRFELPGSSERPTPFIGYHPRSFMAPAIASHLARTATQTHLLPLNDNIQSANVKSLLKQGYGMGWLPTRIAGPSAQYGPLTRAGHRDFDIPLEIRLVSLTHPRHPGVESLWQYLTALNGRLAQPADTNKE